MAIANVFRGFRRGGDFLRPTGGEIDFWLRQRFVRRRKAFQNRAAEDDRGTPRRRPSAASPVAGQYKRQRAKNPPLAGFYVRYEETTIQKDRGLTSPARRMFGYRKRFSRVPPGGRFSQANAAATLGFWLRKCPVRRRKAFQNRQFSVPEHGRRRPVRRVDVRI